MALDYQGGYQPNLRFEVVQNHVDDVTGGLGIVIDGNPVRPCCTFCCLLCRLLSSFVCSMAQVAHILLRSLPPPGPNH